MPHVIVLQHVAPEGPGAIADSLADHGIETRPVRIDQGQAVPSALDGAAGLVVMGGRWASTRRIAIPTYATSCD